MSLRLNRVPSRILTFVIALTLAAVFAGHAPPASAHSVLLGTDPNDGEQLAAAPEEVSLTFNEDITDLGTEVVITTGDGHIVNDGEAEITGPVVSQPLAADRPEGAYTVTWRAVSADGHPISGEFTFTAAEPAGGQQEQDTQEPATEPEAAESAETGEAQAEEPAEDDAGDDAADTDDAAEESSGGLSASTWVIIGVLILAAIILVTILARGMSSRDRAD